MWLVMRRPVSPSSAPAEMETQSSPGTAQNSGLPQALQKLRSRPFTSTYTLSEEALDEAESRPPDGRVRGRVRSGAAAQRAVADDDVAQRPFDLEADRTAEAPAGGRLPGHDAISSSSAARTSTSGHLDAPSWSPGSVQQDETRAAGACLLVPAERRPRDVPVDAWPLGRQHPLDDAPLFLEP